MSRSRPLVWFVFIGYYSAVALLHLYVSNLIFTNPVATPFGLISVSAHMGTLGRIALLFLAVYAALQSINGRCRLNTFLCLAIWLATVLLTSRFLLFHPNEYIHYPQYAILAVLLALCIDPDRSRVPWGRILFWTTLMGVFDEMNQYFYLCKTHGDYLDFNDMLMNLQGAQAGLLLFYGFRNLTQKLPGPKQPLVLIKSFLLSPEAITVFLVLAVISLVLYTGTLQATASCSVPPGGLLECNGRLTVFLERLPHITGSWGQSPSGRPYYMLKPWEGLIMLSGLGFIYSTAPSGAAQHQGSASITEGISHKTL